MIEIVAEVAGEVDVGLVLFKNRFFWVTAKSILPMKSWRG